ncbi:MAG: thymidine phosphorylase [Planctomycetota bacterium]
MAIQKRQRIEHPISTLITLPSGEFANWIALNMLPASVIRKKRDGHRLTDDEIRWFINGFVTGEVADYQMSALAMAICLRGLDVNETTSLTRHMLESGQQLPRVSDRPRIDKHSTGGLGDKVSLILAPLLACFDAEVPMISGRGLGRTGGTLDKLEAIPGFQTQMNESDRDAMLQDIGTFIVGANETVAPADRRLYALRDVTATVESVGLITASILSKKLAATLDALVMDVKVGSGAFMTTEAQATELAESIVRVGTAAGLPTTAILSDMDQPLGSAIGNAIEVNESLDVLNGAGPKRTRELTIELCATLLAHAKIIDSIEHARSALARYLDDGSARERFDRMVARQGGTLTGPLPLAKPVVIEAPRAGHVRSIDCAAIGDVVIMLGGGRRQTGDQLDPSVGIDIHVQIGDAIDANQPLMTVYTDVNEDSSIQASLTESIELDDAPVPTRELIIRTIHPPSNATR